MSVRDLLAFAADNAVTEVLLEVGKPPVFRFPDGLKASSFEPISAEDLESGLREILDQDAFARLLSQRHLELMWRLRPGSVFRASLFSERTSWAASFRLLPATVPSPEDLGFPRELRKAVEDGSGLILVAASSGQGRSTTLVSLVNLVNQQRSAHIVTLERRLKILLASAKSVVFQREVGSDPRFVAEALRLACVQDPDVLMISHMEPAMLPDVLDLVGRGRLVIAGVEVPSAVDALRIVLSAPTDADRLAVLRATLAFSLKVVVAQALLPRADRSGRILACEVLPIHIEEARMLRAGDLKALQAVLLSHPAEGALSIDRSMQQLFKRGLVDRDTARRHMNDQKLLES